MVERLGEMRKGRRERIEKGSIEGIERETREVMYHSTASLLILSDEVDG